MSRSKLELTTTSYAVLGLLCVQPWSAYELTRQMTRSLRFMWPRAESGIYREPQKLVDLGYAAVTEVPAGPRRTKPLYSATTAGRRALRRWLAAPSAPPQFESEAMVMFFFADQGTLVEGPERVHIGSLTGRFVFDYASALIAWATWARAHVDEWPDTGPAAAALGDKVQHENERLAGVDG